MTIRLGILASHDGTSLRAIVGAIRAGTLDAVVPVVIGNNAEAPALAYAREHRFLCRNINVRTTGSAEAADRAIAKALTEARVDLVVLSGYLRKLGPVTLERFAGRILNIHPALLPRFGGQGMYGRHVHEAVLAAGATVSGATIHLVDAEYDHGPVIARVEVPVLPGDDAAALAARVGAAETALCVTTLQQIAAGTISLPAPG